MNELFGVVVDDSNPWRNSEEIFAYPPTREASSPDVFPGDALILAPAPCHDLEALRPKFSGQPEAPKYQCENWYFCTIYFNLHV